MEEEKKARVGARKGNQSPTMSETGDSTEHTAIGVVDSAEEAIGGAEKWVDDFSRTVKESTDSAIRSARSLRENSTSQFRSIQVNLSLSLFQIDILWQQFSGSATKIYWMVVVILIGSHPSLS